MKVAAGAFEGVAMVEALAAFVTAPVLRAVPDETRAADEDGTTTGATVGFTGVADVESGATGAGEDLIDVASDEGGEAGAEVGRTWIWPSVIWVTGTGTADVRTWICPSLICLMAVATELDWAAERAVKRRREREARLAMDVCMMIARDTARFWFCLMDATW